MPKTDSNGQDKSHQKFESMPKPTAVTAASSNSDQNTTLQHPKDKQQEQQVNKLLHSNEDTNFIKDNNKTQQQDPQQNGQQYINQDEQTQQNHLDQNRESGADRIVCVLFRPIAGHKENHRQGGNGVRRK